MQTNYLTGSAQGARVLPRVPGGGRRHPQIPPHVHVVERARILPCVPMGSSAPARANPHSQFLKQSAVADLRGAHLDVYIYIYT